MKKKKNRRRQQYPYNPMTDNYFHPPYGDFPNRRKRKKR